VAAILQTPCLATRPVCWSVISSTPVPFRWWSRLTICASCVCFQMPPISSPRAKCCNWWIVMTLMSMSRVICRWFTIKRPNFSRRQRNSGLF